jgi:hypothetical protein
MVAVMPSAASLASVLAPEDSPANTTLGSFTLSAPIEIPRPQKRNHEDDVDEAPVQQKLKTNKLDAADNQPIEDTKKTSTVETLAPYKRWKGQIHNHTESVISTRLRKLFLSDSRRTSRLKRTSRLSKTSRWILISRMKEDDDTMVECRFNVACINSCAFQYRVTYHRVLPNHADGVPKNETESITYGICV